MSTTLRFFPLLALLLALGAAPIIAQDVDAPAEADAEPKAETIPQIPVPAFKVGERFTTGGSMSQNLTMVMGPNEFNQVQTRAEKAEIKVLAVDDESQPSKVWLKVLQLDMSMTMNGRERPGPGGDDATLVGRTFTVTRGAEGDEPTVVDGKTGKPAGPRVTVEIAELAGVDGDSGGMREIIPERDLTVGETIEVSGDKLGGMMGGDGDFAPEKVSITVVGTEDLDGRKCVVLSLATTFEGNPGEGGPPMTMKMVMAGKIWVEHATGRPAKMNITGDVTISGQVQGGGKMTFTRFATPLPAEEAPADETEPSDPEPSDADAETITLPSATAVVGMTMTSTQEGLQSITLDMNGMEMTQAGEQTFVAKSKVLAVKDGIAMKVRMHIRTWEVEQSMNGQGMGVQEGPLAGQTVIIERKGDVVSITDAETGEPVNPMAASALEQQLGTSFGKSHPIADQLANKPLAVGKVIKLNDAALSALVPAGAGMKPESATLKLTGTKDYNGEKVAVFAMRLKLGGSPEGLAGSTMAMTSTGTVLVSIATGIPVHTELDGKITLSGQVTGAGTVKVEVDVEVTMPEAADGEAGE
jgi:hypothetical protein